MQKSTQTSWCVRRMSFCVFARQCEVVSGGSVSWLISAEIRHSGVSSSPPKERARSQARHHSSVYRYKQSRDSPGTQSPRWTKVCSCCSGYVRPSCTPQDCEVGRKKCLKPHRVPTSKRRRPRTRAPRTSSTEPTLPASRTWPGHLGSPEARPSVPRPRSRGDQTARLAAITSTPRLSSPWRCTPRSLFKASALPSFCHPRGLMGKN